MPTSCKRLIEVALPIREISAESVRDKSLRHGHISTLHLWWARRPLAASRAVVFASLVPDPDDPACPTEFREAVARFLRNQIPSQLRYYQRKRLTRQDEDPYRPYEGVEDTLRNRLLMFVAKWSPEMIEFESGLVAKMPKPEMLLDDRSLVKWETSDPENPQGREILRIARDLIRAAHGGETPTVLDPFSGGGSIPLEAGRLGCQPIANDYNPVAALILRATCEFPQKFGKPGKRTFRARNIDKEQSEEHMVPNALAWDVEHYAKLILHAAREKIGHLYPPGEDGAPVVGYLWARTAPCSNPSCRGIVPLLRNLWLCNKDDKKVALTMHVDKQARRVSFGVVKGEEIKDTEGTMIKGGSFNCPYCGQMTPVQKLRQSGIEGNMGEQMTAAIVIRPIKRVRSIQGRFVTVEQDEKDYRPVEKSDLVACIEAKKLADNIEKPQEYIVPEINGPNAPEDAGSHRSISTEVYGITQFHQLYNSRQLVAMQTLVSCLHEISAELPPEIVTYLSLWISRVSMRITSVGVWNTIGEKFEMPFGRQAIAMVWDYPEANILSDVTGGAIGQLGWVDLFIRHESQNSLPAKVTMGDAASLEIDDDSVAAVITDPPYFDAIAYADLADFFYIWLKRGMADAMPWLFTTPQTPKTLEIVAHKHRHHGNRDAGRKHFEDRLAKAFEEAHRVCRPDGVVSIMFAHQSAEAWSALINAIFQAGLTVTSTYPIDTERTFALKASVAALASSITVTCRERKAGSAARLKDVRGEIADAVRQAVKRFWDYGFRGADLIVACYGPAVGVFGQYERVERGDGTPVEVPELLELAREAALKAIAGEFSGDALTRLYFVWASQYGVAEQSYDDLIKVAQMGIENESAADLARQHGLFQIDGQTCRLALAAERGDRKQLGMEPNATLIDQLHAAMHLWKLENRADLVRYLHERELLGDGPFWKLVQALFEVIPRTTDDWKVLSALLAERETLRAEARRLGPVAREQELFNQS